MQRVAQAPDQLTAAHAMVVLHVPDHRLHRLASLQPLSFQLRHRLDAPPVHHANAGIVRIHAPVAQVHVGLFNRFAARVDERIGLLDLRRQRVPIKGVASEALGPYDQALLMGDRQAHLHAKLVAVAGLALAENPYAAQLKKQITIRIDEDSITYFKTISEDVGIPYQSLINLYLRDCAASHRTLNLNWK